MHVVKRWFVKWSRTVHVTITMLALLVMLFFSMSGFILNHEEWFGTKELRVETSELQVPTAVVAGEKLQLVEFLREHGGVTGALRQPAGGAMGPTTRGAEGRVGNMKLTFAGPRVVTEVEVAAETGTAKITRKFRGLAGVMAELHKGKSTGAGWRRVIDGMAICLFTACVTGFVLWAVQPKRRVIGLVGLGVTAATCAAVWVWLVP